MNRRFYQLGATITTALMASVLFASAAQAASPSQAPTRATKQQSVVADGKRYAAEIKLLDPYVVRNADGTLTLAAPAAVTQRVKAGDLATLQAGLADVNGRILAGQLKTTATHQVYDPSYTAFSVQWNWTGQQWHWWGMSYWYSEYWTIRIENYARVVADVAAVCAFIAAVVQAQPVAIICGLAAVLITLTVDWMTAVDRGGGVVLNSTWTPFPYGAQWIWGQ